MAYKFSFERLDVWHNAKELVLMVYQITKKMPAEERFGLMNQLRRASISVSSNIAEGVSRETGKDQARFSTIAYSSLMEVLNQIIIAKELSYISEKEYLSVRLNIEKVANKISALKKYQNKKAIP